MTILVEGLSPLFTKDVLDQCRCKNIKTVTDFITCDAEDLSKKIKVPYKNILSMRHSLILKYAAFPQNAESLRCELLDSISIINTGSKKLNKFLCGGIYTGEITEIFGSAGSGKTQFCLSLLCQLIIESQNTAIYIDTNNNFDGKRIEEIILSNTDNDQAAIKNLHNVKVKHIYSIYELFNFLDIISAELCKKEDFFFSHLKLIIIDSITPLLSPCFGGIFMDGPGILSNVAQQLKLLYAEHMLSIVVCNNAVSDGIDSIKPALGSNWKYVPSVSLCISKSSSKAHKINTLKSCRKGLFGQVLFQITEAGISD